MKMTKVISIKVSEEQYNFLKKRYPNNMSKAVRKAIKYYLMTPQQANVYKDEQIQLLENLISNLSPLIREFEFTKHENERLKTAINNEKYLEEMKIRKAKKEKFDDSYKIIQSLRQRGTNVTQEHIKFQAEKIGVNIDTYKEWMEEIEGV